MLKITIADTAIPVSDNFSLQLNYENPLFTEDKITKSYSYNFNLPRTPELERIFKHSGRISNRKQTIEEPITIEHSGVLFVEGNVFITKTGNSSFNCFIRGREIIFRNQLIETRLDELKLPVFNIGGDNVFEKLQAWKDFMMQTLEDDVTEGMFKFPTIKASYQSEDLKELVYPANSTLPFDEWFELPQSAIQIKAFKNKEASVNNFVDGEFTRNTLHSYHPNTTGGTSFRWNNTISPCLRFDFILSKIVEYFGYQQSHNDLLDIVEYMRMVVFSGYTLDEAFFWLPGTQDRSFANVHGDRMDLSNFLPDTNMWEAFNVLQQMFNIILIIEGGNLQIQLINNVLNKEAVDLTRYTAPEMNKEHTLTDINGYSFEFELEDVLTDFIKQPSRQFEDEIVYRNVFIGQAKTIGEPQFIERKLSYFPIGNKGISIGDKTAFNISYNNFDEFIEDYQDFNGFPGVYPPSFNSYTLYPYSFSCYSEMPMGWDNPFSIYSKIYKGRTSNYPFFAVTQYLGPIEMKYKTQHEFDNDLPPTGTTIINASSSIDSMQNYDGLTGYPQLTWGEKTIFPLERVSINPEDPEDVIDYQETESKGLYNSYHKQFDEFIEQSIPIDKTLHLPPHKIKELSTFKEPKHRINSPEGVFEGFVQKFSVTLTKDRVGATKVTYLTKQYD